MQDETAMKIMQGDPAKARAAFVAKGREMFRDGNEPTDVQIAECAVLCMHILAHKAE